jgi:hypothetical protein
MNPCLSTSGECSKHADLSRHITRGIPAPTALHAGLCSISVNPRLLAASCCSQALQKIADKVKGQPIDVVLFLDRLDLYRVDPLDRSVSATGGEAGGIC